MVFALVVAVLFISTLPLGALFELIGANAELDGVLSVPRKLVNVTDTVDVAVVGTVEVSRMLLETL